MQAGGETYWPKPLTTSKRLTQVNHSSTIISHSKGSQMPRHLISDAHEWINEIPTVPIYYLAKPQPRERTWEDQRGKKTLLSLTLVSYCGGASLA